MRAGSVVGLCVNISCLLSVLIQPYLPNLSKNLQTQLAAPAAVNVVPEHFYLMLPSGHSIGTPSPLVTEIKPDLIAKLKAKYAGKQSERGASKEKAPAASDVSAPAGPGDKELMASLERQIGEQGDKVRELKSAKAEKSAIDAEVALLLDLKKKLSIASGIPLPAAGGKKGKKK